MIFICKNKKRLYLYLNIKINKYDIQTFVFRLQGCSEFNPFDLWIDGLNMDSKFKNPQSMDWI